MTYSTPRMLDLWHPTTTIRLWCQVETAILESQAETSQIPLEWAEQAQQTPPPTVEDWYECTAASGHEVVGFLDAWGLPHVHIGVTSSDITDTALSLRLCEAHELIVSALLDLIDALELLDQRVGDTPRLGRTHGQAAAPSTYRHLIRYWLSALKRSLHALNTGIDEIAVAKISGPVGTYLHISPDVELAVAEKLNLSVSPVSTQIYMRDGLARWVGILGVLASTLDAIALQVRFWTHHMMDEMRLTKGSSSSAMPHKLNPNALERLNGLARLIRSAYDPIAAGIPQWDDRDMAHSSVEKTLLPMVTGTTHYMLVSLTEQVGALQVTPLVAWQIQRRFEQQALTHSIQTALQLAGYSYSDAQEATREIYRHSIDAHWMVREIDDFGAMKYYRSPRPTTRES